jgi:dienelactone hydrolase
VPVAPSHVGPAADVRRVTAADGVVARIHVPRVPVGPKPVVISPVEDPATLLSAGAVVVTYQVAAGDADEGASPRPGDVPVGAWLLAAPSARTIGRGFFRLIAHEARYAVPRIVDQLAAMPDVDVARIGIAGTSTAAFVALQAVVAEPRIAAAAVVVGCGDYHAFLHLSTLGMGGQPLDLDPEYAAWLAELEPVRHPQRLLHAAVLMVNGATDVVVPVACARRTADVLSEAFARAGKPERFRFVLLEDDGHVPGERAAQEARAWWTRWLFDRG